MTTAAITVNGLEFKVDSELTILQASMRKGIYIPHLCHHNELEPVGACRLCLVEVDGNWKTLACKTKVYDGMRVQTETDEINSIRRVALELLIADHDTDCLACAQNTNCALQRVADHIGVDSDRLHRMKPRENVLPVDTSNPFLISIQTAVYSVVSVSGPVTRSSMSMRSILPIADWAQK